jgi:guanyl-specific ribonuclease Sa
MARWIRILLLVAVAIGVAQWWQDREPHDLPEAAGRSTLEAPVDPDTATARAGASRHPSFLPAEAIATLELIERGGPFPYGRDGSIFQNREQRLPGRPRGYYREYTVPTPGSRDRGARRIVSGGDPPEVYYYTDDHYRTFRRVEVRP